jgi:hypothetical protein
MTTDPAPQLISDDLVRLLELFEDADSVELKLTVPEESQRSAVAALGVDPLDAQIRQVFFFDTPELTLNEAGVVARARRIQHRDADTVVKLRPVVPADLPAEIRASRGFGVEVDAMPGGYVCSASMKGGIEADAVLPAVSGDRALSTMFSKEQQRFFAAHAPSGLAIDDLSVLGPIFVLKGKLQKSAFSRKIVVEMWLYPDGSRILELSTKCLPGDALKVAVEARRFLEGRGITMSGQQQTKTKAALEFFSRELQAAQATAG